MLRQLRTCADAISLRWRRIKGIMILLHDLTCTAQQPVGCMHLYQICCVKQAHLSLLNTPTANHSYPIGSTVGFPVSQKQRTRLRHGALLLLSVSSSCVMYTQQRRVFCARVSSRVVPLAIIQCNQHVSIRMWRSAVGAAACAALRPVWLLRLRQCWPWTCRSLVSQLPRCPTARHLVQAAA